MAGADAWGAPEGSTFARHNEARANVAGNARIIAAPAYRRLLAAEPLAEALHPRPDPDLPDRRRLGALPVADGAARRCRARREGGAGACRRRARQRADACRAGGDDAEAEARRLIQKTVQGGMLAGSHVLAVTDGTFKVVATTSAAAGWQGQNLDAIVSGGQPLFMFGDRAGVMDVRIGDRAVVRGGRPDRQPVGRGRRDDPARHGLRRMAQDRVDERDAVRGDGGRAPRHPLRLFQPGGAGAGRRPHLPRSASAHRSRARARPLRPVGLGHGARQDVLVALDVRHARLPALRDDAVLRRGRRRSSTRTTATCSSSPTGSSRARSTRSTRFSACGTPMGSGCGCAPARRSSIPRRRRSS